MHPAVFLDRDDTLIEGKSLPDEAFAKGRRGDLANPAFVRLLPGVLEACVTLRQAGFVLVGVSNQGVVARGGATIDDVEQTNARVMELLSDPEAPGAPLLERIYYCPYHPEGSVPEYAREHDWRKPNPGMILAAASDLGLDISRSWMVGDMERDAEAGRRAGIAPDRSLRIGPDAPFPDLPTAAAHILDRRLT